ncbi:AcrR family transcriptional regulator [Lipingzhangella halophila]|uniref:AcrR family transcriptional regulator n=1 Tax=Lipingzhangella halophila TaxID=1783352 RepID=A0A7W7W3X6_9ACTN|nr:TetR/AcrR family transcriptional regulator [Lipingzhangella halophila]MBB4932264.1 AcrR family transcriptional regulator [Lipingzhangella halophila]
MATRNDKPDDPARSIAVLWGEDAPRRRGPKGNLTVDRIAHGAIRLADRDGLAALSMQRVAAELGFTTMSIYNHIPSKDLLLEVMMDAAAGEPPDLAQAGDWREAVLRWTRELWASFAAHPWVLRIPVERGPRGPHQLAWFDRLLTQLLRAGLPPKEARSAGLYVLSSVRGMAQTALDLTAADPEGRADDELARLLADVADPERFPALAAVFAEEHPLPRAGTETEPEGELHEALAFGLHRLLDGLEGWVARSHR